MPIYYSTTMSMIQFREGGYKVAFPHSSAANLYTVLDFWEHYGQEKMIKYMYDTARTAGMYDHDSESTIIILQLVNTVLNL